MIENNQALISSLREILSYLEEKFQTSAPFASEINESVSSVPVSDFEEMKTLLFSDQWPSAVADDEICKTEDDKIERAEGILDLIPSVVGQKFLDFGCGEGHVAKKAKELGAAVSLGYDNQKQWNDNVDCLTTDFDEVVRNMPYNIILLFDVLDHCKNPVELLKQVKSVAAPDAYIFCRCHPWISKHGGHVYQTINKAYVHVFFTDDELEQLGVKMSFNQKVLFPIDTMKKWISESGLVISSHKMWSGKVSEFFENNDLIKKRVPAKFDKFPTWQMSQNFNDYELKLK